MKIFRIKFVTKKGYINFWCKVALSIKNSHVSLKRFKPVCNNFWPTLYANTRWWWPLYKPHVKKLCVSTPCARHVVVVTEMVGYYQNGKVCSLGGSVPTRTDLSIQVRIFVRIFSKIQIFGLLYGFFFLKRPFLQVLLINSALLQIV